MNGNGGNQRLTQQTSFRTALFGVAAAFTSVISYLVIKYLGSDPALAGLVNALINSAAIATASYGSSIAERAAKEQTHSIATEAAAETAAAVVRGEDA